MIKSIQLLTLIFIITLSSCEKEAVQTENEKTNHWIYTSMKHDYLFYKDIKAESSYNFNQDPETFFPLLLSAQEKNNRNYYFSYVEKKKVTTKLGEAQLTYGMEFVYYSNITPVPMRITYVLPNSPAAKSGIKRGDWYYAVDGQPITDAVVTNLMKGGGQVKLSKGVLNRTNSTITPTSEVILQASETLAENPIYLDSVYTINNVKVGYLVYNQFASGPDGFNDKTYDNQLKQVFARFKAKGITKLIMDLRFNGGGYISSCQLLCSMITPTINLGKVMAKEKYNDILTKEMNLSTGYSYINFLSATEIGDYNTNISDLYVICSNHTASASELVINALKSYIKVSLVGTTTVGKNMGSYEITDSKYNYIMHPITIQIFNSNNESNYINGFTPENSFNEYEYGSDFLALGNTKELVLYETLRVMGLSTYLKSAIQPTLLNSKSIIKSSISRKGNELILR